MCESRDTLLIGDELHVRNRWVRFLVTFTRASKIGSSCSNMHFQLEEQFATKLTIVYSNGTVLWVPSGRISSHCSMDFTHWPMDTQTCELKFGSWTYSSKVIDLKINSAEVCRRRFHVFRTSRSIADRLWFVSLSGRSQIPAKEFMVGGENECGKERETLRLLSGDLRRCHRDHHRSKGISN